MLWYPVPAVTESQWDKWNAKRQTGRNLCPIETPEEKEDSK